MSYKKSITKLKAEIKLQQARQKKAEKMLLQAKRQHSKQKAYLEKEHRAKSLKQQKHCYELGLKKGQQEINKILGSLSKINRSEQEPALSKKTMQYNNEKQFSEFMQQHSAHIKHSNKIILH